MTAQLSPRIRRLSFSRGLIVLLIVLSTLAGQVARAQGTSLIPISATWKYFADGTNPPAGWQTRGYDDSAWCSGVAKFGFGELNEATQLNPYPDNRNPLIAAYFRHSFVVANPAAITNLTAFVLRDDGAVGYLNGIEVFRSNMATGTVLYGTLAATPVWGEDERRYFPVPVTTGALVAGTNTLAVEVHQNHQFSGLPDSIRQQPLGGRSLHRRSHRSPRRPNRSHSSWPYQPAPHRESLPRWHRIK